MVQIFLKKRGFDKWKKGVFLTVFAGGKHMEMREGIRVRTRQRIHLFRQGGPVWVYVPNFCTIQAV